MTRITAKPTQWQWRRNPQEFESLLQEPAFMEAAQNSNLLAHLLGNRKLETPEQVLQFLSIHLGDYKPTSGLELPDAELALERLEQALDKQEAILVYGDFDVDGITGTSIWLETLRALGAKVTFYVPDRATEGHGLHSAALCRLVSSRNLKLVVTTDTGISNFNEISLIKGLGVDTIVTDHHELPEHLPPSIANVNPQRYEDASHPFYAMAGAGVAFKLAQALIERRLDAEEAFEVSQRLLDLVAVGTVADMVPLVGENRYLVNEGLKVLQKRQRLGLRQLLETAGVTPETQVSTETIGFGLGPRLNAVGRLAQATEAVELLTTQDSDRAYTLAQQMEQLNRKRQVLCEETFLQAEQHLQSTGGLDGRKAIILASPSWNPGIVGIVASRLIEKYRVPTFLMVLDETENKAKCSARSIPGFHLTQHLEKLKHYFINFGGHAGAAGFALPAEKLPAFKADLHKIAAQEITEEMTRPIVTIDAPLKHSQVSEGLLELLRWLAPTGMHNPEPTFWIEGLYLSVQRPLGETGKHMKLVFTEKAQSLRNPLEALWWNAGAEAKLTLNIQYDIAVTVERNTYERGPAVRLILKDIRKYSGPGQAFLNQAEPLFAIEETTPEITSAAVKPLSSFVNVSATAKEPTPQAATNDAEQWIDHRHRKALNTFLGQLMLPAQQGRKLRIFHEGKAPELPFVNPDWLCDRTKISACDELILWDLPASPALLLQVLQASKAQTVHLLGGKYQTVPMRLEDNQFLKGLFFGCKALAGSDASEVPVWFEASVLASRFATTEEALSLGLSCLHTLGQLTLSSQTEGGALQLAWRLKANDASTSALSSLFAHQLHQQLNEITAFRQGLLQAPLPALRSSLAGWAAFYPSSTAPVSTGALRTSQSLAASAV